MRRESGYCVSSSIPVTGRGKFLFFSFSGRSSNTLRSRELCKSKRYRGEEEVACETSCGRVCEAASAAATVNQMWELDSLLH